MGLTLKDIQAKATTPRPSFRVDEWECELYVRKIPGGQGVKLIKRYESLPKDETGTVDMDDKAVSVMHEFIVAAVVNEDGQPLFTSDDGKAFLEEQDIGTIAALFMPVAQSLGLADEEPEKN